jgi:LmbE family N-acetylglucosaminyl deacetylase
MTAAEALRRMRGLPVQDLDAIIGHAPALILAPHPDDESLGCGGLIAAACERRRPPFVVFITDGTRSHPASRDFPPERLRAVREAEAQAALRQLGLATTRICFLRLPDTAAPHEGNGFTQAVKRLADVAARHGCGTVLAPWQHDPHCDHLAAHRMAAALTQRRKLRHLSYPIWGWTLPPAERLEARVRGARMDIRRHLPAKRRAIAAHASQYGGLITDDPGGFRLLTDFLSLFDRPYEVFLDNG